MLRVLENVTMARKRPVLAWNPADREGRLRFANIADIEVEKTFTAGDGVLEGQPNPEGRQVMVSVTYRIPREFYLAIDAVSWELRCSASDVVRMCLADKLDGLQLVPRHMVEREAG